MWIDDLIFDILVNMAVRKVMTAKVDPRIEFTTGVLYDELYGRDPTLPSRTNNSTPGWVISNRGLRSLRKTGYCLCNECGGDSWDANSGGALYICPTCNGRGIIDGHALCVCGHRKSEHCPFSSKTCLHGVKAGMAYDDYPCSCKDFKPAEQPEGGTSNV
jgi:hypothetical protein